MASQGVKAKDPKLNAIPENLAPRFDPTYVDYYERYNQGRIASHQVPLEDFRKNPAKYTVIWGHEKGPNVYSVTDLKCPVKDGEITVRLYQPEPSSEPRGAYINYHGGGWVFGGLFTDQDFCKRVTANVGCVVFDVDYRLPPEHRYPIPLDDSWTAFQW